MWHAAIRDVEPKRIGISSFLDFRGPVQKSGKGKVPHD
jgi:hypothetical protein